MNSTQLRRAIPEEGKLPMAYRGKHGVREVEAELLARWSGRRRAVVAGQANSGEAPVRAVVEASARVLCCCVVAGEVERRVGSTARSGR